MRISDWSSDVCSSDLRHIQFLARAKEEHYYDLPDELVGKIWNGQYRGQRQVWFLARFTGTDDDVNIETDHQEFRAWKWADPDILPELIVPFKRKLYRDVLKDRKSTRLNSSH